MSKVLRISMATAIVAAASVMAFAAVAQAQDVVGQIAPGGTPKAGCGELGAAQFDLLQFGVLEGNTYEVRDTGVITSWSTNAAAGPNQTLSFKVFRRIEGSVYLVVAHDTRTLTAGVVNTFKVHIPVHSGDVIGLNSGNASPQTPNACEFPTGSENDDIFLYSGDLADQGLTAENHLSDLNFRANVSATVLPPPEININGRESLGSITGGATVALKGFHFSEVSRVSFGGVPAARVTVDSEQQITAVAPAGRTLDEISAEVTTPAGTAVTPARFSYSGCIVPKLKGKKLKAAKSRLKGSGCKLGKVKKVRGARSKRGKVVQQNPKPGKVLAPGSKVSLKVGK